MADTEQQQQIGEVTFYKSVKSNSLKVIKLSVVIRIYTVVDFKR